MRRLPDPPGYRWLDALDQALSQEAFTMVGAESWKSSARAAALHHVAAARLEVPRQIGRSTPAELQARVDRLLGLWRRMDDASTARRRRHLQVHPSLPVPEEPQPDFEFAAGEPQAETAYDPAPVECRRRSAPEGRGGAAAYKRAWRRRKHQERLAEVTA
jgi:hypothetical protein